MPKVNVYLPDVLAERVREARLPVSRICQAALTQALDGSQSAAHESPAEAALPDALVLDPPPNHHVAAILRQAYDLAAARGSATVEPVHLLQAFLDEGESLVLNTVELLGFATAKIQSALDSAVGASSGGSSDTGPDEPVASAGARAVLKAAAAQASAHSSAVTTGSHLLLGLIDDDGPAGRVLKSTGLTDVVTPAVLSALYYGVAFGRMVPDRDTDTAVLRVMMQEVLDRLDQLQR